jgi:hypothetical protein
MHPIIPIIVLILNRFINFLLSKFYIIK